MTKKPKIIERITNLMRLNTGSNGYANQKYLKSLKLAELKRILYSQECLFERYSAPGRECKSRN